MIQLVAALGNPGYEYTFTRHNIAWLLLEHLSFFPELKWKRKFNGLYCQSFIAGNKCYFLKPETYMNRSGLSLVAMMNFYQFNSDNILIIHDEIEMEFGMLDFKNGGGLAGHNGLRSISSSLGTRNFKRLRLGISKPDHGDITSHVLSPFTPDQQEKLVPFLEQSAQLLENCLLKGFGECEKDYRKKWIIGE